MERASLECGWQAQRDTALFADGNTKGTKGTGPASPLKLTVSREFFQSRMWYGL
jgi:hypothetical protein